MIQPPMQHLTKNGMPNFNLELFKKGLPSLNNNMLSLFVNQAKQQGISEKDIEDGLKLLNSIR